MNVYYIYQHEDPARTPVKTPHGKHYFYRDLAHAKSSIAYYLRRCKQREQEPLNLHIAEAQLQFIRTV